MSDLDISLDDRPEEGSNRLETMTAILIALVIVIGALVAWRASVADDSGGDADFAGLKVATSAEETRALTTVNAYEHYSAYTNYRRNTFLSSLIEEDRLKDADLRLNRVLKY